MWECLRNAKRSFLVAIREFLENVRTKGFWIGIAMLPIMLLMIGVIPIIVESTREAKRFTVIDRSGWLLGAAMERIELRGFSQSASITSRMTVATSIRWTRPSWTATFSPTSSSATIRSRSAEGFRYVSNNLTDRNLLSWFSDHVNNEVRTRRLRQENLTQEVVNWVSRPVEFEGVQIAEGGVEEQVGTQDIVRQWTRVAFVYLLWISIPDQYPDVAHQHDRGEIQQADRGTALVDSLTDPAHGRQV
ncbi:MAG: hypothetical protein U5O39_13050 [Gammaproteobacteria bacterium]|nr:hypothetical protein [Gammaproteobacteria bacterium]